MAETRSSFAALPQPEKAEAPAGEVSGRSWFDLPDGTLGILFLLLLSSFCGGMIAVYWPFAAGGGGESAGVSDRLSTLETKVDALTAGRNAKAAMQMFAAEHRDLAGLKSRLDADEARLAGIEKSQGVAEATDIATLKAGTDKNAADVQSLSGRVGKIEDETGPGGAKLSARLRADIDSRTAALHDEMSRFDMRIAALEKSALPADIAQRLDSFALRSEEGAIMNRDTGGVMRRAAAVMALADLVRASAGGDPFIDELAALKSLAPTSPEIQDLGRFAGRGVPNRTMLADSFSKQADGILAAGGNRSLSERIWSSVMSVPGLRNIVGNDPQSRVARAEVDLNLGEIARAVKEMNALSGPARNAAEPWLKSANERLTVDRDMRLLAQRLVSDLSMQVNPSNGIPTGAAGASK